MDVGIYQNTLRNTHTKQSPRIIQCWPFCSVDTFVVSNQSLIQLSRRDRAIKEYKDLNFAFKVRIKSRKVGHGHLYVYEVDLAWFSIRHCEVICHLTTQYE